MSLPPYLEVRPDSIDLTLKVQPRASRNQIAGALGNRLRVKISAPPVDAAANEALLDFLAEVIGCRRQQLQLVRGHTSRHKHVRVIGVPAERVARRLQPAA